MTDFERRLTEALTSGAEAAPDADRLAVGARTRAKARRRTRSAVVVGSVVAALAAPVGVFALTGGGDDNGRPAPNGLANDPTDYVYDPQNDPNGTHTIEHEGVMVDIPNRWVELDTASCEFQSLRWAPDGVDPCQYDGPGLAFYGSATFDPATGPGTITLNTDADSLDPGYTSMASGYVYGGDYAIYVQAEGLFEAKGILGSVRQAGEDAPELRGWRTESYGGLAVDVPDSWQRGGLSAWCLDKKVDGWVENPDTMVAAIACTPSNGYGVRFGQGSGDYDDSGFTQRDGPDYPEQSWAGIAIVPDETGKPVGFVEIVAPTQALAEVIGGSLRVQ